MSAYPVWSAAHADKTPALNFIFSHFIIQTCLRCANEIVKGFNFSNTLIILNEICYSICQYYLQLKNDKIKKKNKKIKVTINL